MTKTMKQLLYKAAACLLTATVVCSTPAAAQKPAAEQAERPKAYLVADAHLDTQWNWDIQATISEYVRNTLFQNLLLMREYPDYVFNFEGGVKYAWMKEYYPAQYELLKPYIRAGRWHICGTSWDATDTLVPSIESAIRNILLGQEFYRREFGVESTDIFLPDCFGFGWTLPTVAAHCGLIGFSSQKLGWRYLPFHDGRKYPFSVGLWQGVDGAQIMFAHGYDYNKHWDDADLSHNGEVAAHIAESTVGRGLHYYGTGDIGGSPTLSSVSAVEKGVHGDGPVEIISAASDQLYRDFLPFADHPELPVYDGELLMDVHGTGCYTSQAAMKLYNRQNELLGDAAERASVAASLLGVAQYPSARLTENWRRFIFHQFHDDLTGTSIPRAYEFSWNDELIALKQFAEIVTDASGAVSELMDTRTNGTPVLLYNALGYEATDVVEVTIAASGYPQQVTVVDHLGHRVEAQPLGYADGKLRLLIEATVPANGYAVYDVQLSGVSKRAPAKPEAAEAIENSRYRLTLNASGDIVSLVDKRSDKELVETGKAIRLALFTENESYAWPAWEVLKKTVDAEPVSIGEAVTIQLVEEGALRKTLCVEKQYGASHFRQYIRLYEGALADRIDFFNEVQWQTTNALLKAEFPLAIANRTATYDLGVGTIVRGNNRDNAYEVYAQQWADLTDRSGDYGVTILNDCKYGWDKPDDHTLRLTLLHTPKTDRGYPYQDHQDFGYHTFTYSFVGHAGTLEPVAARRCAEGLNQRIKAFAVPKHAGTLGKSFSAVSSDNEQVTIKALKLAESSDEYVVRVYESGGTSAQTAMLTFAREIESAATADGTEKTTGTASFAGNRLEVSVPRNGIATYKVRLAAAPLQQNNYQPLALAFDKKCFSWNEFKGEADFQGGYSYALELIPAELTVDRVPFRLERHALLNGMQCKGQTIQLPAGNCNRLYLLAAAATNGTDLKGTFRAGKLAQELTVPSYTGFVGQWGHTDHTQGYLKEAQVAWVGTHRHSLEGDHPYEFTYLFKFAIELPAGATEVTLPDAPGIVLFAATAAEEPYAAARPLSPLFRTSQLPAAGQAAEAAASAERRSILQADQITGWSGCVNDNEHPRWMVDGDETTKWCDINGVPSYVDFDLGQETPIHSWKLVNAARENLSYVTATALLLGRSDRQGEWLPLSYITGNKNNIVQKLVEYPRTVRYLRLVVIQPTQAPGSNDTRIYELEVYDR